MPAEVIITVNMPDLPECNFELVKEMHKPDYALSKDGNAYPVTAEQAAAILALNIGSLTGDIEKQLYAIAEPAFTSIPAEARVIP
jgi:hypothetical protein